MGPGYYDYLRASGKQHHAAIRALAFEWQRILFRCSKDQVPHDIPSGAQEAELSSAGLAARLRLWTGQWKTRNRRCKKCFSLGLIFRTQKSMELEAFALSVACRGLRGRRSADYRLPCHGRHDRSRYERPW
jgi:hypothetical protein